MSGSKVDNNADSSESGLALSADGWCRSAFCDPSPNFDDRPCAVAVSLLVIHCISLPAGQFGASHVADLFCNRLDYDADPSFEALRGVRVSAHFLIGRHGALTQFVSANARAWHAGASVFAGQPRCNDFSIGIELEGTDAAPFTPRQYQVLTGLTVALQNAYPLTDVVGHEHIASGRKTDPGPFFDWVRYRNALMQCEPTRMLSVGCLS
jgi:AmpD protein